MERPQVGPKPRILFVSYTAERTGPTNSLVLLLDHLRVQYEIEVVAGGTGSLPERLQHMNIRFHSLPTLTKWQLPALISICRKGRFDLVYANSMHRSSRLAFVAARMTGIPFVNHVREMVGELSRLRVGYLRRAEAVIAVSRAAARELDGIVSPRRLHVVHNGVPIESADRASGHYETRSGDEESADSGCLLFSAAHIMPRKGQLYAVEAMERIVRHFPKAQLQLVGHVRDAEYAEQLTDLIERLDLADHVQVVGFLPDVSSQLRSADIFVHTALAEPHPRSVLEAMLAGLPVVAFATDGVSETVLEGETGLLVPPGDSDGLAAAVCRLADDPGLRRRMGERGRKRVREEFSSRHTADGVAAVLAAILPVRP